MAEAESRAIIRRFLFILAAGSLAAALVAAPADVRAQGPRVPSGTVGSADGRPSRANAPGADAALCDGPLSSRIPQAGLEKGIKVMGGFLQDASGRSVRQAPVGAIVQNVEYQSTTGAEAGIFRVRYERSSLISPAETSILVEQVDERAQALASRGEFFAYRLANGVCELVRYGRVVGYGDSTSVAIHYDRALCEAFLASPELARLQALPPNAECQKPDRTRVSNRDECAFAVLASILRNHQVTQLFQPDARRATAVRPPPVRLAARMDGASGSRPVPAAGDGEYARLRAALASCQRQDSSVPWFGSPAWRESFLSYLDRMSTPAAANPPGPDAGVGTRR